MKIERGDGWRSCELQPSEHEVVRIVVTEARFNTLRAEPVPSAAGDYFLSSFEIRAR